MQFIDDTIIGADVSFYQDADETPQQIDFTKMVEQGASFVVVRAGQNEWVDPDFVYNWTNAKYASLPRGSYWFYDSRREPTRQAEVFASLFYTSPPELELWLDLEENYGGAYQGWQNWKKFLVRLRQLMPTAKIGVYTGYYYITGKIPLSEYIFFSQFVLWIAWYTNNPSNVLIPKPWTSCLYWQWGTPVWGLAWGCESLEIDMNKFNGTKQQFIDRYGTGSSTPDPTPGGAMIYTVRPKVNDTKIFRNPDGSGGNFDDNFDTSETAKGDGINSYGYMHLYLMGNAVINGYVHMSKIIYTQDSTPPPTETGIKITSVVVYYTENGVPKSEILP